jgi:hypothetical protein
MSTSRLPPPNGFFAAVDRERLEVVAQHPRQAADHARVAARPDAGGADRLAANAVPGTEGVPELFLDNGGNLLQLTNFGRNDTGQQGGLIARHRILFTA